MSKKPTQPHHRWLAAVGDDIQREYEAARAAAVGTRQHSGKSIQRRGHLYESLWRRLLLGWLPPAYEVATRKYLVLGDEHGESRMSPEIDLVIFNPNYPRHLRDRSEVLVSGVVAAFSVKGQLTKRHLSSAVTEAAILRRGLGHFDGQVIGELASPLLFGVLASTYKSSKNSKKEPPQFEILDVLENASGTSSHPRENVDVVCVADLDCWFRSMQVSRQSSTAPHHYFDLWMCSTDEKDASFYHPVAALIAALWAKLAARDQALSAISEQFRRSYTAGPYGGVGFGRPLQPLISEDLYSAEFSNVDRWSFDG